VGLESLALLREETLGNAQAQIPKVALALQRLRQLVGVEEVRQCGLMAGIQIASQAGRYLGAEICERARLHGVILRPLSDVIVWMPPLSLQSRDLEILEDATAAAIREVLG
jgi:adenosylmethionine-8-amino-7-oxononanoate aminotransferase